MNTTLSNSIDTANLSVVFEHTEPTEKTICNYTYFNTIMRYAPSFFKKPIKIEVIESDKEPTVETTNHRINMIDYVSLVFVSFWILLIWSFYTVQSRLVLCWNKIKNLLPIKKEDMETIITPDKYDDYFYSVFRLNEKCLIREKLNDDNFFEIMCLLRNLHKTKYDSSSRELFKTCEIVNKIPFDTCLNISYDESIVKDVNIAMNEFAYGRKNISNQLTSIFIKKLPQLSGAIVFNGQSGTGKTHVIKLLCNILNRPFCHIDEIMTIDKFHSSSFYDALDHNCYLDGIISFKYSCANDKDLMKLHKFISNIEHTTFVNNMLFTGLDKCLFLIELDEVIYDFNPVKCHSMNIVNFHQYSNDDKFVIAKKYMIPKYLKKYNLEQIIFPDNIISYIILKTSDEDGVGYLDYNIEHIICAIKSKVIIDDIPLPYIIHHDSINKVFSDCKLCDFQTKTQEDTHAKIFN
jgi:hypothetical protein